MDSAERRWVSSPLVAWARAHPIALLVAVVALLKLAVLAEYVSALPYAESPISDAKVFDLFADRMLRGHWVHEDYATMSPLAPFVLIAVKAAGIGFVGLYALQLALGLVVIVWVHRIARHLFGEPRAPLLAAVLYAFYGPAVFFETKALSASLALFFIVGALWFSVGAATSRARGEIGTGLFAAIATLLTPQLVPFAPILAAVHIVKRRFARAALLTAAFVAPLVPFAIRNGVAGAGWSPLSTQFGATLYHGNHLDARGDFSPPKGIAAGVQRMRADERRMAEEAEGRLLSVREVSSYFLRRTIDTLLENPLHAVRVFGLKVIRIFMAFEPRLNYDFHEERAEVPALWAFPVPFSLLAVFGALGLWFALRARMAGAALVILAISVVGTMLAVYVASRYRLPLVPVVAIWAALGIARLVAERRFRLFCVGVVASGVLILNPLDNRVELHVAERLNRAEALGERNPVRALAEIEVAVRLRPMDAAVLCQRARHLMALGRLDEADGAIAAGLRARPNHATASLLKGRAVLARNPKAALAAQQVWRTALSHHDGHRALTLALAHSLRGLNQAAKDEAVSLFEGILMKDSRDADAHGGLGQIQIDRGDFERAAESFTEATKHDPDFAPHWANLGYALLRLGRFAQSARASEEALAIDPTLDVVRANLAAARRENKK
ncbi:MAG: tetratricopeptide repeat protein [Deltaproteobacteria bacterium]|nr:tetratricopeptide repeat protein [Deltaproteobacteria bacterium]